MKYPICYYGNPVLRQRGKEILEITAEIVQLCHDMVETMDANRGVGLAAPQIGRSLRLFVIRNPVLASNGHWELKEPEVYINPKLSNPSRETDTEDEPCISLPGIYGAVERPLKITVEALDIHGKPFLNELSGYKARVIMHENDHINGVLYIDRMTSRDRKKLEPYLRAIKTKYSS